MSSLQGGWDVNRVFHSRAALVNTYTWVLPDGHTVLNTQMTDQEIEDAYIYTVQHMLTAEHDYLIGLSHQTWLDMFTTLLGR